MSSDNLALPQDEKFTRHRPPELSIPPGNRSPQHFGVFSPMVSPTTSPLALSEDLNPSPKNVKINPNLPPRTKIICTMGPASKKKEVMKQLMLAGMNVLRLNFSHGDHTYHQETINLAREVMGETRRLCALLLDTKGPEIRSGLLKEGKEYTLEKGQEFTLVTDESVVGDNTTVAVQYKNLPKVLKVGDQVLVDDGLIALRVQEIREEAVKCLVENTGVLGQRKGINLPGVVVDLPAVTQKDIQDIKFAVSNGMDFIAASFVRKPTDILTIREALGVQGKHIQIIAKIENQEGLDNFDEILKVADGIMVARGDLGVEIPIEQVALAQKMMIRKCNAAGKLVITATQMLESMVKNPSPTRAEASDVANAVFDGSDCVMLSGETAKGLWPLEAVQVMADICREAEASIEYRAVFNLTRPHMPSTCSISEAVASAAVKASYDLKAALIICLTESGNTARLVAKYRPAVPILTITANEHVAKQALAVRGLFPLLVGSMVGTDSLIHRAMMAAQKLEMCQIGDYVVITSGVTEAVSGATNMLKIVQVSY